MQVVNPQLLSGKKVLLRLDIDVPIENGKVAEDFRLMAGLPTLKLCADHADKVILLGHLGRPVNNPPDLSVRPVLLWYQKQLGLDIDFADQLEKAGSTSSKLVMLENIRFFDGEIECDMDFAKKLASLGDIFVNEAFASYNPAASTTVLPTLLPSVAGLRFKEEVEKLTSVREHPKKPFVAIMGGVKVAGKLPIINVLAGIADAVLVGGKLISEIREQNLDLPKNVLVGKLAEDGSDIAPQTTDSWENLISRAAEIVWNGPVGKFEDPKNEQTKKIAQLILSSDAEIIIGGGDSIAALTQANLLQKAKERAFVSTGGGAMLKFLADGTLPTIEALK